MYVYVCVCMYVCVCVYVCMYVCMYVCVCVCIMQVLFEQMGETNALRSSIIAFVSISPPDFKFVNAITPFFYNFRQNTAKCTLNILPLFFVVTQFLSVS